MATRSRRQAPARGGRKRGQGDDTTRACGPPLPPRAYRRPPRGMPVARLEREQLGARLDGLGSVVARFEGDDLVLRRVAHEGHRLAALLDQRDLLGEQLAEEDDAAVGGAQVLPRAVVDGAL